ncbi:MAG: sortase [Bifidobacteriaceae bacterium]|jgi:LPXTG-site transpeptidase (sortase) family protein|nr:sortase [Bifidobacteriaceae bacterium]
MTNKRRITFGQKSLINSKSQKGYAFFVIPRKSLIKKYQLILIILIVSACTTALIYKQDAINYQPYNASKIDYSKLIVHTSIFDDAKYIKEPFKTSKNPEGYLDIPGFYQEFGKINIDSINIEKPLSYSTVIEGDYTTVGMYTASAFPGYGGTTLLSGHNYPDFGHIYDLQIGDTFKITVDYGEYTYRITKNEVMKATELEKILPPMLDENYPRGAVLYSCYPLNSFGTPDRTVVTADLIDGPLIPTEAELGDDK